MSIELGSMLLVAINVLFSAFFIGKFTNKVDRASADIEDIRDQLKFVTAIDSRLSRMESKMDSNSNEIERVRNRIDALIDRRASNEDRNHSTD